MDSNTLLVLIIDGGLILFFIYALYYISKLSSTTIDNKPIIKQEKEKPTAIKAKDYEPTYTPITARTQSEIELEEPPTEKEPDDTEVSTIANPLVANSTEKLEPLDETSKTTISESHNIDVGTDVVPSETLETPTNLPLNERLQSINIIDVEGIGPTYETRLKNIGIDTVADLLSEGATPKGRKTISEDTNISPKLVLEWVNICDLYRISGVGEEYSDLLEEAGVDTVPELARRNPTNLHTKMSEVNEEKNLVRRLPSVSNVERWVEEAKKLPRIIEY